MTTSLVTKTAGSKKPTFKSDEELVLLAQKQNTNAFEQLIKRYENKIYSLAYRILGDSEEAYDVLQETAISAYQHLNEFKGKSSFFTWLYRIALNAALMKKRKKKHSPIYAEEVNSLSYNDIAKTEGYLRDWSSNPDLNIENKELRKVLQGSLDKLPDKYRNVVILADLENKSLDEISKILNISVAATKSRLHRARMYLRWMLDRYVRQGYLPVR